MKVRVEVRLSPGDAKKLNVLARARDRHPADTLRVLIAEEHDRLVASRGEVDGSAPTTKRGE
jgi:hypothetical protein